MRRLLPLLLLFGCPAKPERETPVERTSDPIATSTTSVLYRISFAEREANYVNVEGVFPAAGRKELVLMMPVWIPGSYLVREYARNVHDFSARGANGPLRSTKIAKNRWRITSDGSKDIAVRYRLYARHANVRESYVDRDLAVLNGAATFFADASRPDHRFVVELELPREWKRAETSLARTGTATFIAEDFDTLVDSPILAGNSKVHRFEVEGVEHVLVNSDEGLLWDGPRSAKDVAAIAETIVDFWGVIPYQRYVFLNVINDARGGLEHENSTLVMTPRWRMRDEDEYRGWLGTMAHEHFHAWNGKRLRPVMLGPFDYEREVYTTDLWIVEGLTTYYDDLLVMRAGLMDETQYLAALSKQIENVQHAPGRKHDSLAAASYDAWIEFYRWDENSNNVTINYYAKGAVVGFLVDAAIRRETNDAQSLDDVFRAAYRRYSGERGYTTEQFLDVVEEIAGAAVRDLLVRMTETTEDLDYEPAFDWYGLEFEAPSGDAKAYLGVKTAEHDGRTVVREVVEGAPAHGKVNAGDEIIAIDGLRVDDLSDHVERYRPKDEVKILVARRGLITELTVVLDEKPSQTWKLRPERVRSATQIQRFKKLLAR